MAPPTHQWMKSPDGGVCTVCGRPLAQKGGRFWLTAYPDGVHQDCRAWELEPFPFHRDLVVLRKIARAVREAWKLTLAEGRWLAVAQRRWPEGARAIADKWLDRKSALEHRLSALRERLRF